jgi:hypothetical protein
MHGRQRKTEASLGRVKYKRAWRPPSSPYTSLCKPNMPNTVTMEVERPPEQKAKAQAACTTPKVQKVWQSKVRCVYQVSRLRKLDKAR